MNDEQTGGEQQNGGEERGLVTRPTKQPTTPPASTEKTQTEKK